MIQNDVLDIRTARILVVDDLPDICTVCRVALRQEDHEVETAGDAETALQMLEHEAFDLLLTDISMPQITGLELARRAQRMQPLLDVVIMTGQPTYALLQDALQQGIADYLPKPFNIDQLRLTITRTLKRQRLRRENLRLQSLTHVIEAGRAFANSLDQAMVADALIAAVQRETGLTCVHVELEEAVYPTPGAHPDCFYRPPGEPMDEASVRLQIQAHQETVGQIWIAAPPEQRERLHSTEVLQLLIEHGALALYNAEMYTTLTDLDRQKSEFIALASHELRTPLSVVLGYGGMLRGKLQDRQNHYMQEINRAALRINDLVDDLINLRQIQRGDFEISHEEVDLQAVVRTVYDELRPLAEHHEVELMCRVPHEPIMITGDPEALILVLANLVSNGIRFTPPGGRVTVTLGQQSTAHGGDILLVVDDTGIGIAPHEVQRIFKRFYQVAESRTREQGGLGIGLALARGILEVHGGHLSVRSTPGRGSRFVAALPATLRIR